MKLTATCLCGARLEMDETTIFQTFDISGNQDDSANIVVNALDFMEKWFIEWNEIHKECTKGR